MRILIIEDDPEVSSYLAKGLQEHNYVVDLASNGKDGLFLATTEPYDLLIVDRMLPNIDGLTIIRTLRTSAIQTPVLILSALAKVDDRVAGLRTGGDDYLTKPFSFSELLARIEALLRRTHSGATDPLLRLDDLELDTITRTTKRKGQTIALQPREFRLLEYLLRHCGQVVTRTMLLEHVWDYHFDPQTNVIDVHVSRLRNKIDKPFDKPLLHTVRGAGYILKT